MPAMTTTPITTPAAIPAVFGLLGAADCVGVFDVTELVSAGVRVADGLVDVVDDTVLLVEDDETAVAVGMLAAIPLS